MFIRIHQPDNPHALPRRADPRNPEPGVAPALPAAMGSVSKAPSGRNVGSPGQVPLPRDAALGEPVQKESKPRRGGARLGHSPRIPAQASAITPAAAPPITRSTTPHSTQRQISREAAKPRSSEARIHPVSPFAPSRLRVPPSPRMTFYTEPRAVTVRHASATAGLRVSPRTRRSTAVRSTQWFGHHLAVG
jgi:hypothetical protein